VSSTLANNWASLEGEVVDGKYHLTRLIASGGFGGVFEADQVIADQLIRRVAIKLIASDSENDASQIQELVLSSSLDSDFLVRTFDPGRCTLGNVVVLYIVMELASDTLGSRLLNGPVDETTASTVVQSTLGALDYLVQRNVPLVHRDVKPDNLLLVGPRWKLADFGLLRTVDPSQSAQMSALLGTAEYAPPEAFDGVISPPWDMWSLGVLIVEMLTGAMPFWAETPQELQQAILSGQAQHVDNLPAPFRALASQCLTKDREQRPSPAEALAIIRGERSMPAMPMSSSVAPVGKLETRRATFPFRFKLGSANTLPELIDLCEEYPYEAQNYLYSNYFNKWLLDGLHDPPLAQESRSIVSRYSMGSTYEALEMMLRELRRATGLPVLPGVSLAPPRMDFGMISVGSRVLETVRYACEGHGHIWGRVLIEGNLPGLSCPDTFVSDGAPIPITLDTLNTPPGLYEGRLAIAPEGFPEPFHIPVTYTVAPVKAAMTPRRLDLGEIEHGQIAKATLVIGSKDGKSRIAGLATIVPPCPGVSVTAEFQGVSSTLTVTLDTSELEPNREYMRRVQIQSTGGRFDAPIRIHVVARLEAAKIRLSALFGALVGIGIFALARWGIGGLIGSIHSWTLTLDVGDVHATGCRLLGTPVLALATSALLRMLCRWRWPLLFEAQNASKVPSVCPTDESDVDDDGRIDLRNI